MKRRHVESSESARLPRVVNLRNWTASPWEIVPAGKHEDGHHDDFVVTLTGTGPNDGLKTTAVITSYDLDGRTDEELEAWTLATIAAAVSNAMRRAAAA